MHALFLLNELLSSDPCSFGGLEDLMIVINVVTSLMCFSNLDEICPKMSLYFTTEELVYTKH